MASRLTVYRPKSARYQGRYILTGVIDEPRPRVRPTGIKGNEVLRGDEEYLRPESPRVLLVNRDFPWITTTAFRADEIEEVA